MLRHLGFLVVFFITFISHVSFGQSNRKAIQGKIKSSKNDVSDLLIINLNSKTSTISDSLGLFSIEAKFGDSIRFTAVQYLTKDIIVTNAILQKDSLIVTLVENVIKLNEVTITPYNLTGKIEQDLEKLTIEPLVTSYSLGLPNANLKVMTHNELLLNEADQGEFTEEGVRLDTLFIFPVVNVYVDINLHKTLNFISGRTKKLKDAVSIDEKTALEEKIIATFPKKTLSENFDIPEPNIDAFLTYCLSQEDFSEVSRTGNMLSIWEYLATKSIEFKKIDLLEE